MGDEHRCFGRRRLVAVYAERQPNHNRAGACNLCGARRIDRVCLDEGGNTLTNRLHRGVIGRRGDRREHERPPLVRLAEFSDFDEIRPLRQLVEVVEDAFICGELLSDLVAEELIGAGEGLLCDRSRCQAERDDEESDDAHATRILLVTWSRGHEVLAHCVGSLDSSFR